MEALLNYIFQVNILLTTLALCYWLCCSRNTFFQCRRLVLAFIWLGASTAPLIRVSRQALLVPPTDVISTYTASPMISIVGAINSGDVNTTQDMYSVTWIDYIGIIYLTIAFLLLLRLGIQLFNIFRMVCRSQSILWKNKTKVQLLAGNDASFSFFGWIFIYEEAVRNNLADDIVTHESAHSHGGHSLDIFLSEIFKTFCWFNPVAWFLTREIRRNLEYIADRQVLSTGFDRKHYQMHLLQLTYRIYPAQIYNSFNYSHLKQRIQMMNKQKSKQWIWMVFTIIPTVLLTLVFSGYFVPTEPPAIPAKTLPASDKTAPIKEGFDSFRNKIPTVRYNETIDGRNRLTKGRYFMKNIKFLSTYWPNNVTISKVIYLPTVEMCTDPKAARATLTLSVLIDGNRKVAYIMDQPNREYTTEQAQQMYNLFMQSIDTSKELQEAIQKKECYEFWCTFQANTHRS